MVLKDEIQRIMEEGLALYPRAKLALEGDEDAIRDKVLESDPTLTLIDLVNFQTAVIASHRDALMLLANEIDALKAERE